MITVHNLELLSLLKYKVKDPFFLRFYASF
jgi:hypothetical protein